MFSVVFFGSFQNYSVQILEKLLEHPELFKVVAVVTTPPRPAGREMALKPTEVQVFAEKRNLPVFSLELLEQDKENLHLLLQLQSPPDFLIAAGYGKLIPRPWLEFSTIAPVNVHFSLLPDYPGRCPAEWALLMGEKGTGATLITMSPEFDKGEIIAQEKIPIYGSETRETLYKRLYDLGGDLVIKTLPEFARGKIKATPQDFSRPVKYARQITREDGFVPFEVLKMALRGHLQGEALQDWPLFQEVTKHKKHKSISGAEMVERMLRAFASWPGVWTTVRSTTGSKGIKGIAGGVEKRFKILSGHLESERLVIDALQVEGRSAIGGKDARNFLASLTAEK